MHVREEDIVRVSLRWHRLSLKSSQYDWTSRIGCLGWMVRSRSIVNVELVMDDSVTREDDLVLWDRPS